MQDKGYFEKHPCYEHPSDPCNDIYVIERFVKLSPDDVVAIIGCGYGREAKEICKHVALVYGIDVNETILKKARDYVEADNFTTIVAEKYHEIPAGIDLVYSIVTMQHLTRDLVSDYLRTFRTKLAAAGSMVIQFLESEVGTKDAFLKIYEPSVSWTLDEIKAMGLKLLNYYRVDGDDWTHHWVQLR